MNEDEHQIHKKVRNISSLFALGAIISFLLSIGSITGKICGIENQYCEFFSRSEERAVILMALGSIFLFISMYLMPSNRKNLKKIHRS